MSSTDGRVLARTILVFLICSILAFLIFVSEPGSGIRTAGAQASPTPSGYTIEWVNPSAGTSTEVSAQQLQGQGNPDYHLVAWVNRLPADPFVEFCTDDCNPSSERITPENEGADFVAPDTYEWFWTTLAAEGSATLRARLFSGTTLLDEDTVTVTINNTPDNAIVSESESVEITDPPNGQDMGFYRPPGATRYTGVLDVVASDGATQVEARYTISAPGTEPNWKLCGTRTLGTSRTGSVRCDLAEGDTAQDVTAVAAVAYDDPGAPSQARSEFREAADAHRIEGYTQVPQSVILEFAAADGSGQGDTSSTNPGTCSPILRATVLDQNGEAVPQVNVDLHALGPDDDIRFVQVTDHAMKAPDQGGHTTSDPASNCTGGNSGTQGEHDSPADDDMKHIESTNNTNDAGQFSVQMFHANSGEVPGTTQVTAWADLDGNDQFCSQEPSDNAAVGWGQNPTVDGLDPETTVCTLPGATPTPTSSPSPTPTGNTTPTTTSPTTTSSPTPQRQREATNLTINYRRGLFSGSAGSSKKRCQQGRSVKLKKHTRGPNRTIGENRTNRSGSWKVRPRRVAKGRYYAVVAKKVFTQSDGIIVVCRRDKSATVRAGGRR